MLLNFIPQIPVYEQSIAINNPRLWVQMTTKTMTFVELPQWRRVHTPLCPTRGFLFTLWLYMFPAMPK